MSAHPAVAALTVEALRAQRNEALDLVAQLRAEGQVLQARLEAAVAENARLCRDAEAAAALALPLPRPRKRSLP